MSLYLLLNNIGKRQNFGTLIRSACAFGVKEILVVGGSKISTFGNQGTEKHAELIFLPSLEEAKKYLVARGVILVGVEITEHSKSLKSFCEDEMKVHQNLCIMLGNEGTGMSDKQKSVVDYFVYIPQFSDCTASLNVATAGAIVFYELASSIKDFTQAKISGEKFIVKTPKTKLDRFLNPTDHEKAIIELKRKHREESILTSSD
jgi:tRNA G18 (ribose-2'-O)-methylase SpoU